MKKSANFIQFFKQNLFHLLFLFSAYAILVVSTMTILYMTDTVKNMNAARETLNSTEEFLINNYRYRLNASASAAQHLLAESDFESLRIKPGSPDSPEEWHSDSDFLALRELLMQFADENGLEFVYYFFRIDNFMQPLIDNDLDLTRAYTPSNQLMVIDAEARGAWNTKQVTVPGGDMPIDDSGLITAYAPVLDGNGEVIALAGVDLKDEQINPLRDQIVFLGWRIEFLSSRMTFLMVAMICALLLLATGGAVTFANQRKSSKALQGALLHAEHASRAKSVFLAHMSHEMRTPLNAIIGMTTIGKNSSESDRKQYSLNKIEEASRHLLGVINDVLDYSKIEAGKLEFNEAAFCFEDLINKVCSVVAFKAAEKKQNFHVSVDERIPRLLIGDEQHISQVVTNLLSNAIKFTHEKGSVTLKAVSLSVNEGVQLVRVDVSDTGIGISNEQKEHIFRSFEQADNTITKRFGGTGLGLAISKSIVEGMGGELKFESEFGKGTTFSFEIGLRVAAPAGAGSVSGVDGAGGTASAAGAGAGGVDGMGSSASGAAGTAGAVGAVGAGGFADKSADGAERADDFSGRRMLLVDDVEINREIVITLLEPTNIEIDSAENGAIAVKMFAEYPGRYDIIFMDVQMPEMDGYQASRTIRAMAADRAKTVPIIAMTANVFKEDIEQCLSAGMNAHIGKPLDIENVMDMLREYLTNFQRYKQHS